MNLPLTTLAQTTLKLTVGWTPPAGVTGYRFLRDGVTVSTSWDAAKRQVTFGLDGKPHTFQVVALSANATGTVTVGQPATTVSWADVQARFAARPAFTPARPPIVVTSGSALQAAVANIQPGDLIDCQGGFTTGQLTVDSMLADWAEIHLNTTKLAGGVSCLYCRQIGKLRVYDGEMTGGSKAGIQVAKGSDFAIVGFNAHDNKGDGLELIPGLGPISRGTVYGTLTNNGLDLSTDPHDEKGTGLHGCQFADGPNPVTDIDLALDVRDQNTGAAIQIGQPSAAVSNINLWLRVQTLGRALAGTSWAGYAKKQVAGNALQFWGGSPFTNIRVKYLEAHDCQGRAVEDNGVGEYGNTLGGVTVEYARAVNTNLSAGKADATLSRLPSPSEPYSRQHGVVYQNVG